MKDLSTTNHFPPLEKLVQILCKKTQNNDPLFFRILTAYHFSKVASMMRCDIKTKDRGIIPINMYATNLATSGFGKGFATNILEEQVTGRFRHRYLEETFPAVSEKNLAKIANKRAAKKGEDPDEELELVEKEFKDAGEMIFSFDSGTTAAVKQMRYKLLMANAGSMNMEIDEIASNLLGNVDVLTTFLELFDVGKVKQKLIKNTSENTRGKDMEGRTPTNMLLFGTPAKLLNGGKVEDEFISMVEIGFGRRCFFGYCKDPIKDTSLSPEQVYDMLTDSNSDTYISELSNKFTALADMVNFGRQLTVTKEVTIEMIKYKLDCEKLANELPEHETIRKAELSHRYFKALKLAGTYAFIDGAAEIDKEHLFQAMKLAEESGVAFDQMLTRDKNYVKLAKFISSGNSEMTHADILEELPCYKGSEAQKREMLTLAIAWGYKNNVIIKKSFMNGIEFLEGESLQETDQDQMIVSYSNHVATGYRNETVKFCELHKLIGLNGYHWVSHHLSED